MIVVDASVLVAAVRAGEPSHAVARAFLTKLVTNGLPVVIPAHALAECATAIARGTNDSARGERVVTWLIGTPGLTDRPIDYALAIEAARAAANDRLRGSDAVYVALARGLGVELVTLDQEMLTRPTNVSAMAPAAWLQAQP